MIHLYFHGGSGNHGCEAIVRSTLGILGQDAVLHTSNIASDRAYGLDKVTALEEEAVKALTGDSPLDLSVINGMIIKHRANIVRLVHGEEPIMGIFEKKDKTEIDEGGQNDE